MALVLSATLTSCMRLPGGPSMGVLPGAKEVEQHLQARRQAVKSFVMSGAVDLTAFSFDLTGEIVLTDPEGLDLRTASVHFDGQTRHLSGHDPLQLRRPPYTVAGQRFTYEVTTQRLVVDGAVSVIVAGPAT